MNVQQPIGNSSADAARTTFRNAPNDRILRIAPENGGVGEIATQTVKQHDKDPGRETFYCPANFDVVFTIKE